MAQMVALVGMSRLYWDGRQGYARFDLVEVELRTCPLPPPIHEVDYSPEDKVALVREAAEARRDMTPDECRSCEALLRNCASAARAALSMGAS